jgi:hypothetical protein
LRKVGTNKITTNLFMATQNEENREQGSGSDSSQGNRNEGARNEMDTNKNRPADDSK